MFEIFKQKYDCRLSKTIFHRELEKGEDKDYPEHCIDFTLLRRQLELPFPPFPGLTINDWFVPRRGEEDKNRILPITEGFYSGPITTVHWDNEMKIFNCTVKDQFLGTHNILGAVLAHHLKRGWELDGYYENEEKLVKDYVTEKMHRA